MARVATELLRNAADLPKSERLRVVEELLASFDKGRDRGADAALGAEVEKRSRELKRGIVRPVPWATVRSRARRRASGK
jgi:putative addiction module component (TIGR02574 family)